VGISGAYINKENRANSYSNYYCCETITWWICIAGGSLLKHLQEFLKELLVFETGCMDVKFNNKTRILKVAMLHFELL
jgi:hypothetical protein